MKLAIILFLCLVPLKLAPFTSTEQRFPRSAKLDRYVLMEQDVTRVEREFQKHLFRPRQMDLPAYGLRDNAAPVIKKDTWTPWDDRKIPIGNDRSRERPYAILPNSISFPDVKKRLLETFPFRRNGRKHDQIFESYL
jgi:hypothetical protein